MDSGLDLRAAGFSWFGKETPVISKPNGRHRTGDFTPVRLMQGLIIVALFADCK